VSAPDASQNGAPPPPPQPTGSPFGRFLTQPVFLVALLALMVSAPVVALVLRGGDAGGRGGDHEPAVVGTWAGSLAGSADVAPVAVELTISSLEGGTMARGGCRGELTRRSSSARRYVFTYREQSDLPRCPRRSTVIVEPLDDDRLRFEERRRGRVVGQGVLGNSP
jgi:hypothetical protein